MKNPWYLLTLLLLVTIGAVSCKKDMPDTNESGEWGEANALRNGSGWQALCATKLRPDNSLRFGLAFSQYNSQHYLRNEFNIKNLPYIIGQYFPLQNNSTIPDSLVTVSFFTSIEDGDVLGDQYILLKDSAFSLNINSIDYSSGVITGTFEGQLKKLITSDPERDPASPDTLRFENGTFKARVRD